MTRLVRILFELGAELRHEVVDGARLAALAQAPHLAQQLVAREDSAAVAAVARIIEMRMIECGNFGILLVPIFAA